MNNLCRLLLPLAMLLVPFPASAGDAGASPLRDQALSVMKRAASYYYSQVATRGGYVYHYSPDLSLRYGEGPASAEQIWVQPPGTPTVGMAFLRAYKATGDPFYLDAARDAAEALVYGQLASGGWTNSIDFNPRGTQVAQYRNGRGRGRNNSTLDDGISQGAMRLLMHVDQALEFKHAGIHEAAEIALTALLDAQFPNGGFPQVWTGPVVAQPVVKARFPGYDWRTDGRIKNYWDMYTLNDDVAGNVADVLIDAHRIYGDQQCALALRRLGDFLILAQLPQPQPAWAQQYSYEMHPIWARRFEPPAVTGGESQEVLETLIKIARVTGDRKYLEPVPAAVRYLKSSLLPEGRLARYYELETNRPLYMNRNGRDYALTYDDSRLPDHYGWKIDSRLDEIQRSYEAVRSSAPAEKPRIAADLEPRVRQIIAVLDPLDRWLSVSRGERLIGDTTFPVGSLYLSSEVFSHHVETLSEYVALTKP